MNLPKLTGLIAATYTPFRPDGSLNLPAVEPLAAYLLRQGITTVFIAGTTGENHSLSLAERLALTERWVEIARGTPLKIVVHVGGNCLSDARALAAQAQALGAIAMAATSPSYYKPRQVDTLASCLAEIASAAPELPFYYYDIPSMTGVNLSAAELLPRAAERIPSLAGLKFSNPDLMTYQLCLRVGGGRFDVLWGSDEYLLAALALGGRGAVGSTYNFAAPIYQRLILAFDSADLATAREEQFRSVRLVQLLGDHPAGFMSAAKALMGLLGVDLGPARLPHPRLSPEATGQLRAQLEKLGFFDWIR
jgi:N-acetylneuraminate lyase